MIYLHLIFGLELVKLGSSAARVLQAVRQVSASCEVHFQVFLFAQLRDGPSCRPHCATRSVCGEALEQRLLPRVIRALAGFFGI